MRRRWSKSFAWGTFAALAVVAAGCNALNGTADLVEAEEQPTSDSGVPIDAAKDAPARDASSHVGEGHVQTDAMATVFDAGDANLAEAGASVCEGLTLLLRFDGSMNTSQGQTKDTANNNPNTNFVTGKYGQGVVLGGNGTKPYVDYASTYNSKTILTSSVGTIAMWVQAHGGWSMPNCGNNNFTFFEVDDTGVYGDCEESNIFGIWVDLDPQNPNDYVGTGLGSNSGYNGGGFNHLAMTWSTNPAGLSITLNGSASQSGTQPWAPPDPSAALIHLGDTQNSMVVYDDVAIWTRVLTQTEIAAIYGAGKSLGDLCGLP